MTNLQTAIAELEQAIEELDWLGKRSVVIQKAQSLLHALDAARVGEVRFNEFCCPYPVGVKLSAEQMDQFLEPIHENQGTLYFSPKVCPKENPKDCPEGSGE